jgi:hypothetical protein
MKQDYENRRADNQNTAIIVNAWRGNPPTESYHYERPEQRPTQPSHAADQRKPSERIGERPVLPPGLKLSSWRKDAD